MGSEMCIRDSLYVGEAYDRIAAHLGALLEAGHVQHRVGAMDARARTHKAMHQSAEAVTLLLAQRGPRDRRRGRAAAVVGSAAASTTDRRPAVPEKFENDTDEVETEHDL